MSFLQAYNRGHSQNGHSGTEPSGSGGWEECTEQPPATHSFLTLNCCCRAPATGMCSRATPLRQDSHAQLETKQNNNTPDIIQTTEKLTTLYISMTFSTLTTCVTITTILEHFYHPKTNPHPIITALISEMSTAQAVLWDSWLGWIYQVSIR